VWLDNFLAFFDPAAPKRKHKNKEKVASKQANFILN
jgi:hypothetical protein